MPDAKTVPEHDPERLLDDLNKEYYAIVDAVSGFDQRSMTIKGWSVTLSLVGLGLGFQQGHYALFALAAGTALAFWYLDALNKRYQLRHYSRMRDIEVAAHSLNNVNLQLKFLREDHSEAAGGGNVRHTGEGVTGKAVMPLLETLHRAERRGTRFYPLHRSTGSRTPERLAAKLTTNL